MPALSSRFAVFILRAAIALLCSFVPPAALAHQGHHAQDHKMAHIVGSNFTLESSKGPVALSDFHGKVAVLYFGYTNCTDACPLDLSKLARALKMMKPEAAGQIQPIFITLDPARDDAKRMAKFSATFDLRLLGLTGTEAEVAAVAKAYGVHYEKGPVNAAGGYDIDHPSDLFLVGVGRDGELLRRLPGTTSAAGIAKALRKALQSNI